MSYEFAIKVENLSKYHRIYDQPHDRLKQMIVPRLQQSLGMLPKKYYREFCGLKNVSFEVKKGETVGIIGRNGSGKSTLLQLICGTLNPTSGSVRTHGRIAALLELGSGFNLEFTGRENVFVNAAVLGLSRAETEDRLDAILAFADIGDFIDHPIKTYSSGMVVRLAFAVAINVAPEILVIDEALSVGDELFQRKCFSSIEAIRASGATILFVSHSGSVVVELCDRAILLDSSEHLATGNPQKIVGLYHKLLYAPREKREAICAEIRRRDSQAHIDSSSSCAVISAIQTKSKSQSIDNELHDGYDPSLKPSSTITYESGGALIEDPCVFSNTGERVTNLTRGRTYFYRYQVRFNLPARSVKFGMLIKTTSGVELGGAASASSNGTSLKDVTAGSVFSVEFAFVCRLNAGVYFLNAGVVGDLNGGETYLHRMVDAAMFRVMPETLNVSTGVVDFSCVPKIELVEIGGDA